MPLTPNPQPSTLAQYIKDGFPLHIFDCLKGLQRAISMSWVQPRFDGFDFMYHDYFVRDPEI
jgi:hypothetical protein